MDDGSKRRDVDGHRSTLQGVLHALEMERTVWILHRRHNGCSACLEWEKWTSDTCAAFQRGYSGTVPAQAPIVHRVLVHLSRYLPRPTGRRSKQRLEVAPTPSHTGNLVSLAQACARFHPRARLDPSVVRRPPAPSSQRLWIARTRHGCFHLPMRSTSVVMTPHLGRSLGLTVRMGRCIQVRPSWTSVRRPTLGNADRKSEIRIDKWEMDVAECRDGPHEAAAHRRMDVLVLVGRGGSSRRRSEKPCAQPCSPSGHGGVGNPERCYLGANSERVV